MKFEIKHRWSSEVLFEAKLEASFEKLNFSLQLGAAVKQALEAKANLSKANLSKANLSEADLSWADLSEADLSKADLSKANLSWADLSEANLSWADLSKANLSKADLSWADLSKGLPRYFDEPFTKNPISIAGLQWSVGIIDTHMRIGCEFHTHTEWKKFTDREIASMDGTNGLRFWKAHKTALLALCAVHEVKAEKKAKAA